MAVRDFFTSPVEAELVSLHPRKQGPDDDRVLVYDIVVDIQVPNPALCNELDVELSQLLFGFEGLFNWVNPTVPIKKQDVAIGFAPITSEDDDDVEIFIPGAVVKLKKAWPGEIPILRVILTWEPDSKRDVNLIAEQLEEAIWLVAVEYVKEQEDGDDAGTAEDDDDSPTGTAGDEEGEDTAGDDSGGS